MSEQIAMRISAAPHRRRLRLVRLLLALAVALLPSPLKVLAYRLFFGYRVGRGIRVGFGTVFFNVGHCRIGDQVRIGCFNVFAQVDNLDMGNHVHVGMFNLFRGGDKIKLGDYATIMRFNVFNSIIDPDATNELRPEIDLGTGVVVTTGHWLDFSDWVSIGPHSILGGRSSSLWTHNRQRTRGISIGPHCYLGSEIRMAPGVEIPAYCIVAIGAVIIGQSAFKERSLIAGNPAAILRPLRERDLALVARKTRRDIPDDIATALLTDDLRAACEQTMHTSTDKSLVDT
jgi:acetyltransferase-like isoleucine patch superfamily enzyme